MPLSDPNDLQAFSPWKLDFRQVGTGHLETRLAFRSKSAVSVLRLNMSEVMHQRGQSPNGVVTFALSRAGALRQWQGEVATPQTMFGFGAGAAFDCVSEAGFEADVLSFDLGRFQALADQCGFALSDDALTARLWDTSNSPNDLAGVASHISSLLSVPARDWPEDSEEDLGLALLRLMTDGAEHLDRSPFRARDRAMRRALDVTDTTLDDPLPIPEICKLSGASWRTLDRAFKENFDIGPKSYYLRLRLLRARQMLGASGPRGSVGEVANMNGFWHMGQFARDYRKLFGERPSETVALRE
ncbi:MAG: helix-turn-helix domain-containing protein [Pseudomonadota bacterium]